MMLALFERLRSLHLRTALLESLEWDEEALEGFMEELGTMLLAAPPNVDKALFWIRNTPWDSFGGKNMPDHVFQILESEIKRQGQRMQAQLQMSRRTTLPEDSEWN